MHPGFFGWWKLHRGGPGFAAWTGCGPGWAEDWCGAREERDDCGSEAWRERFGAAEAWERRFASREKASDFGGGAFGVRRPLRFFAFKLGLDGDQVNRLAAIFAELKTERAQAEVDRRRTAVAFADSVCGETFDSARAAQGAALQTDSATRIGEAVLRALERIHALLEPEQRERLAYLIRTGVLQL